MTLTERNRTMIVFFLLCVIAGMPTAGQLLDVCTTCHKNATCDDKSDGSGKVCNCKYGFVGNGRTFCQDKDECQIGAIKICGQHTKCHNTYGSYYCTCLSGYSPSNNMATFIPNDGTHCRDIDECRITGLCGAGGRCWNLEGSFECSCQLGYRVSSGAERFHPHTDKVSCKVVDCGLPATVEDATVVSLTGTTYRSVATFACDEGFIWARGDNTSVCGADGLWRRPTMVCEETVCGSPPKSDFTEQVWDGNTSVGSTVLYFCKEGFVSKGGQNLSVCNKNGQWTPPPLSCQEIFCGDPPILPHTGKVWNGSSTPGSTVTYYCKIGFYHSEGNNVSLCTISGYWTKPHILCKEVQCGAPPPIPHSVMLWDETSTVGSQVVYECKSGYQSVGGGNVSVCTASGEWDELSLLCQEINCQEPVFKPHTKKLWDGTSHIGSLVYYQCDEGYHTSSLKNYSLCGENGEWEDIDLWCEEINCQEPVYKPHTKKLWDGTSHIGSVVYYQCDEGYHTSSLKNYSLCGENGEWEDIDLWCEEISCGPPLVFPNTNLLWDQTSRPGSVVLYECVEGFYLESGNNISVCSMSGEWGKISVKCRAKCGPVPVLDDSEVVWHNRSVVIHRCVDGFHSWRGSNISVCGISGVWQKATLRCIEIKPPITHLYVLNEKCVHWKAEKYDEDTEVYKVTYLGSRDYQRSFRDKRKQFLSSKGDQLELCLNLLPVTNYSISITAIYARFTVTITTNTSLPAPPAPVVYYREFETPVPTLRLRRSVNTLDPISLYQVFVLPVEEIMVFDCSSPGRPYSSSRSLYITAQILIRHVGPEMNFTVGDGLHYGGFYNAPLENGVNYYIILRAVSQWKTALKSSCVLWAKITGTSYILRVSSLCAAVAVGLVALALLGGYSCIWFFKKT